MACPAVLEREQEERIQNAAQRFFPLVRFCLIITAVEYLAKVRNLLFPLSEQPNKSSEGPAQTNAISFFYLLKEKLIKDLFLE